MSTIHDRARIAAKSGYGLSELINCPGFFFVHKPNGDKYLIDATSRTCDCPASTVCKHIGLVEICRAFWLSLSRKRSQARRHFSRKHLAAFRALAPTMAGPAAANVLPSGRVAWTPEEYAQHLAQDFC